MENEIAVQEVEQYLSFLITFNFLFSSQSFFFFSFSFFLFDFSLLVLLM